jgi:hypothetical protein
MPTDLFTWTDVSVTCTRCGQRKDSPFGPILKAWALAHQCLQGVADEVHLVER